MWAHMMMMGGCGRAARPSDCTKQEAVEMLQYTPFKKHTQAENATNVAGEQLDHPLPSRSTLLPLTTHRFLLHPHK